MAFLNALTGVFRSRSPMQPTGAASPSMEVTSTTNSAAPRDDEPPAAKNDSEQTDEDGDRRQGPREGEPAFERTHNW